jgi:hypothetical protein
MSAVFNQSVKYNPEIGQKGRLIKPNGLNTEPKIAK